MTWWDKGLIVLGALSGLLGVGLSAAAAHLPSGASLETAARFLLLHAPALLAIAALAGTGAISPSVGCLAGWAIILGLGLFCGDLVLRTFREHALFPMAAPIGGVLLMGGWAFLALAALIGSRG